MLGARDWGQSARSGGGRRDTRQYLPKEVIDKPPGRVLIAPAVNGRTVFAVNPAAFVDGNSLKNASDIDACCLQPTRRPRRCADRWLHEESV